MEKYIAQIEIVETGGLSRLLGMFFCEPITHQETILIRAENKQRAEQLARAHALRTIDDYDGQARLTRITIIEQTYLKDRKI